jgi:phosphotriesterase-related protein
VAIGHCDSFLFIDYHEALLKAGAYVQFDNIGFPLPLVAAPESQVINTAVELVRRGWANQLLLSQDVCRRSHLKAYGGNGYDYLLTCFLPRLRAAGVDDETLHIITVENPRRLLAGPL